MKRQVYFIFLSLSVLNGIAQQSKDRFIVDNGNTFHYTDSAGTTASYLSLFGDSLIVPPMITLDGRTISQNSMRGKTVVFNFWFTRCAPCVAEMPILNRLSAANWNDSIVFIGITFDARDRLEKFLASNAFDFVIARLPLDTIQKLKKVSLFPLTMILDKHQRLTFVIFGRQRREGDDEAFYNVLNRQLKKALLD